MGGLPETSRGLELDSPTGGATVSRMLLLLTTTILGLSVAEVADATCTVGVYSNAAGSSYVISPADQEAFHVYVVVFDEAALNAVSYGLDVPGLGSEIFLFESSWGPTGNGINILTSNGNNVGLGDCVPGFYGVPILVADYTFVFPAYVIPTMIRVVANPDSDPDLPVVSDCSGELSTCEVGPSLFITTPPFPTESRSFGAVKALYDRRR
jgi:hypothetical protein